MKRIVSVTAVFLCGISLLQAQPVRVSETLKELEMENISVVEKRDTITAAFETSAYRGIYNGIGSDKPPVSGSSSKFTLPTVKVLVTVPVVLVR